MIKAYQIVDLNNPISVEYMEGSLKTFEPVRDLIEIVPYQCITPSTLPVGIFSDTSPRAGTEKAIAVTHYNLIKRIAEGEQLIILEHDAFLMQDRVDIFRNLLDLNQQCVLWNCGIALECYTLSRKAAKQYCQQFDKEIKNTSKGPMSFLHNAGNNIHGLVLWPLRGQKNLSCLSYSVSAANVGDGELYKAPITQYVKKSLGVTNSDRTKKVTEKSNPDILFFENNS